MSALELKTESLVCRDFMNVTDSRCTDFNDAFEKEMFIIVDRPCLANT